MKKIGFLLMAITTIASCTTGSFHGKHLNENEAYLAGYFGDFDHRITFVNLENQETIRRKFRESRSLRVVTIPPGRYAVAMIDGRGGDLFGQYEVEAEIPLGLMTIIEAQPGTITFIGNFDHRIGARIGSWPSRGQFNWSYDYERFEIDILEKYQFEGTVTERALNRLSIN